jgi:hypothetical protein
MGFLQFKDEVELENEKPIGKLFWNHGSSVAGYSVIAKQNG